jgi:apolipoprotein N-acyltransferase
MRKVFSVSSLILGILFFVVFIVAACSAYYLTAGVFVTAELAALYAGLGFLGAFAVVFRGYIFSTLFYIGCALGWATGHYVSTLEGDFAPTAGVITTFFLIGCFALVGFILEMRRLRRRRRKRMEQRQAEWLADEQRKKALLAE